MSKQNKLKDPSNNTNNSSRVHKKLCKDPIFISSTKIQRFKFEIYEMRKNLKKKKEIVDSGKAL